jgi:glutathione S-transferase
MSITLHHNPFSRAATVVWMLEEVGVPYALKFVDFRANAQKSPELLALNPMGKLPVLEDGDLVVTEGAAIGLYLADRYALGRLAPLPDDPARGTYLRWSLFAPTVIEPAATAHFAKWEAKPGQVGWGTYETMLDGLEHALRQGSFLLGERFTMADVIFGGTLRYMLRFKMVEARPSFAAYVARLDARPAYQAAEARNGQSIQEHGLGG